MRDVAIGTSWGNERARKMAERLGFLERGGYVMKSDLGVEIREFGIRLKKRDLVN